MTVSGVSMRQEYGPCGLVKSKKVYTGEPTLAYWSNKTIFIVGEERISSSDHWIYTLLCWSTLHELITLHFILCLYYLFIFSSLSCFFLHLIFPDKGSRKIMKIWAKVEKSSNKTTLNTYKTVFRLFRTFFIVTELF